MSDSDPLQGLLPLTRHVGVVVLPGFSLLAQACATEPLAVANRLTGRALYRLATFALDERAVASHSRQWLLPQVALGEETVTVDMLLVGAAVVQWFGSSGAMAQADGDARRGTRRHRWRSRGAG